MICSRVAARGLGELTYPRCDQRRPLGNDIRDDPLMRRKTEAAKGRSGGRGSSRYQNLKLDGAMYF